MRLPNWRVGVPVLIVAGMHSPVGAGLTPQVDKKLLLGMSAAFLVFVGFMMLFFLACKRDKELGRAGVGSMAGFLGGLLGVGGGDFVLPVLN
jgi:hypothetical protein